MIHARRLLLRAGRERHRLPDLVVPTVVAVGQLSVWTASDAALGGPRVVVAVLAAVAAAALVLRRRRALASLAGVVTPPMLVTAIWAVPQLLAFILPLAVAVFAAGRHGRAWQGWAAALAGTGAVLAEEAADPHQSVAAGWEWSLWIPLVVLAGRWLGQHDQLAAIREGEVLERARAEAAERRLALSRELHDVLTHGISVMVVQAEAAQELLAGDPDRARKSLQAVSAAGRGALEETRRLVGQLREDLDGTPDRPSLAAVRGLVEQTAAAGLPARLVDERPPGRPDLSPDAQATGFRVVQESLTNVLRHAGHVDTVVRISSDGGGVVIEVLNGAGPAGTPSTDRPVAIPSEFRPEGPRHGLTGLAERVAACGGRFEAGERAGGFVVRAWLPLEPAPSVLT